MINKITSILLLGCIFALFTNQSVAQSNKINFKFEVDGKSKSQKFKVLFYIDGIEYEARSNKKSFFVPPELQKHETFTIRFVSKKYDLYFSPIFAKDLNADWTIGVDNRPFDKDKINTSISYDDVYILHSLSFEPKYNGLSTVLIMKIYNRAK